MIPTRLRDTWQSRELPVLVAAAQILDLGERVTPHELADAVDLDLDLVEAACEALVPTYLTAGRSPARMGGPGQLILIGLTDQGRRATGLWPDGDTAVEQLLDALRQAESLTSDPDDQTALRKAGGQLASVSRGVLAEVIAAVVTRQAGL
ncbi:hypothetical protein SFC79_11355 [Nocardioides sp. S-58]|uniref:Uncharacterized protein n=1 Tax=Nocardioides renjunii TaxID=3095075 RepID=A0ABU5KBZ3_9ACTN|nr:hypothetical protein [Nocardioides sp. S-58]MDZ5662362.1 hypothetical protein [Nocardioides sp. S-58]